MKNIWAKYVRYLNKYGWFRWMKKFLRSILSASDDLDKFRKRDDPVEAPKTDPVSEPDAPEDQTQDDVDKFEDLQMMVDKLTSQLPETEDYGDEEHDGPYLSVTMKYNKERGNVSIDADYNDDMVREIDIHYQNGGAKYYRQTLPSDQKVAIYLTDTFLGITKDVVNVEDDDYEDSYDGGMHNMEGLPIINARAWDDHKTVVDISDKYRPVGM